MKQKFRRRKKLIKPRLQLKLVGSFVGLAGLALLLQFLLLGYRVANEAAHLEGPGGLLTAEVPRIMLQVLAFSLVVLLPIIFAFGVLLTFRIAGPIYRFETYLAAVARGEESRPCKIREGDMLQSLCDRINEATEPLLRQEPESEPESEEPKDELRSTG